MNAIIPLGQVMNQVLIALALTVILLLVVMCFVKRPAVVLLLMVYRFLFSAVPAGYSSYYPFNVPGW